MITSQARRTIGSRIAFVSRDIWKNKWLYIFVIPGVVFFLIFCYQPMYGLLIAFKKYDILKGVFGSPWAANYGFKYFIDFFKDRDFEIVMKNTLSITSLKLVIGFPLPILFALMINEIKNVPFKKITQSISYIPHFVSWVVVSGLIYELLSIDKGSVVNTLLLQLRIIDKPIFFMGEAKYFLGLIVGSDIWKSLGFSSIIYLASISSVNPELYESAMIDGAKKLKMAWHITLPGIKPTIMMLFILSLGGILNAGFDQIFVMKNQILYDQANIIDMYVYHMGLEKQNYEIATAVGIVKSIGALILLFSANYLVKRLKISEGIL